MFQNCYKMATLILHMFLLECAHSNIALQWDILPWMCYDSFEFSFNDLSPPIPLPPEKWKPGRATILTSSHYKVYLAEQKKNKEKSDRPRPNGGRKGTGKL